MNRMKRLGSMSVAGSDAYVGERLDVLVPVVDQVRIQHSLENFQYCMMDLQSSLNLVNSSINEIKMRLNGLERRKGVVVNDGSGRRHLDLQLPPNHSFEFEEMFDEFAKLKQVGSVNEFYRNFVDLITETTNVNVERQVNLFVEGLKDCLREDVKAQQPKTLKAAFNYARLFELRNEARRVPSLTVDNHYGAVLPSTTKAPILENSGSNYGDHVAKDARTEVQIVEDVFEDQEQKKNNCEKQDLKLIDVMPERNLFSWNSILFDIRPTYATLVSLLSVFAHLGALDQDMYADCGSIASTNEIFYNIKEKNMLAWNIMISSMAMYGNAKEDLKIYEDMQIKGDIKPVYALEPFDVGKFLEAEIVSRDQTTILTTSYLLENGSLVEAHVGKAETMLKVLQQKWERLCMLEVGEQDGTQPTTSEILFLLLKFSHFFDPPRMLRREESMVKNVWRFVSTNNFQPQMMNSLVAALSYSIPELLISQNALQWVMTSEDKAMTANYQVPSFAQFVYLMLAGVFVKQEKLLNFVQIAIIGLKVNIRVNDLRGNAFICMKIVYRYADYECLDDAKRMLDEMPISSVYLWNVFLRGTVTNGERDTQGFMQVFSRMLELGMDMNVYRFSCLIHKLAGCLTLREGMKVHVILVKNGWLPPSNMIMTSLMDMYFRCGQITLVWRLFAEVIDQEILLRGTMISGFAKYSLSWEAVDYIMCMIFSSLLEGKQTAGTKQVNERQIFVVEKAVTLDRLGSSFFQARFAQDSSLAGKDELMAETDNVYGCNGYDPLREFIRKRNLRVNRAAKQAYTKDLSDWRTSETYSPVYMGYREGKMETTTITKLLGQPDEVTFDQYAGYVTVNSKHGRALFYSFVESPTNASTKPLVLWLNGGPGCSSLGSGAMIELGQFPISNNGKTLYQNPYAWNKEANVLFLESPTKVSFSYSNTSPDYDLSGDKRTARQTAENSYRFLITRVERFPQYKSREFNIVGENYAVVVGCWISSFSPPSHIYESCVAQAENQVSGKVYINNIYTLFCGFFNASWGTRFDPCTGERRGQFMQEWHIFVVFELCTMKTSCFGVVLSIWLLCFLLLLRAAVTDPHEGEFLVTQMLQAGYHAPLSTVES